MIAKEIFAIVFVIFALSQSQARPGLKSGLMRCYSNPCDADPTLIDVVDVILQDGVTEYKNDYCRLAQYAADGLKSYIGGDWVVLIGAHGVMDNSKHFAAQFDKVPNTYLRASYKDRLDILVVKPLCSEPNLQQHNNEKDNGGSARVITKYNTTMPASLRISFQANVNRIFDNTNSDYEKTANQVLNYAKNTCGGNWFVLVGPEMVLNNNKQLCGVANKSPETSYNATYEYSDSINIFSPICN